MLGKKWWRFTVNFDQYLRSPEQESLPKPKRHVLYKSFWRVTVAGISGAASSNYNVRLLYTVKSYLKWNNHEEFKRAIREKLLATTPPDVMAHVALRRNTLKLPVNADMKDPINLILSMLHYADFNYDSGKHAELLVNYLADKQYKANPGYTPPFTISKGYHGETVMLLKDAVSKAAEEIGVPVPVDIAKSVASVEERVPRVPKGKRMEIKETKVTFR